MSNVSEHSASLEKTGEGDMQQQLKDDDADTNSSSANNLKNSRKRKQEEGGDDDDDKEDTSSLKKPRVAWTAALHQQFIDVIDQLGVDKAVPKKILELMNVPSLTRDNVASHLQKYRMYLKRRGGVSQHQGHMNHSFVTGQDPNFGPISTLNGFDLHALAVAGQLPAQSLSQLQAGGLGRLSSLTGDGHGHRQRVNIGDGNNHMSLLHGVPMGHMRVQQIVPQNVLQSLRQQQETMYARNNMGFPQHNNNNGWGLQNIGMVYNSYPDTTAAYVQQSNNYQQPSRSNMRRVYVNGGSVRVVETVPIRPATTLFRNNQEDLMGPLRGYPHQ